MVIISPILTRFDYLIRTGIAGDPGKLKELQAIFMTEAGKYQVFQRMRRVRISVLRKDSPEFFRIARLREREHQQDARLLRVERVARDHA